MHSLQRILGEGPLQSHVPAALAAGAQLEKSFSGSVTTAVVVAAAAREADMPTGKKERGPKLPESSVHEESAIKFLAYWSFLSLPERTQNEANQVKEKVHNHFSYRRKNLLLTN